MRQWSAQNLILSPHPLHYVMGYALVGLLALGGSVYILRRHDAQSVTLHLVGWTVVVPPLLYLPFNLQRRLVEGCRFRWRFWRRWGWCAMSCPRGGGRGWYGG
jgi:hypothetical protein